MHGDDADSHRRRTFMCVSWQSAVTHGSTLDTIFPIYVMDNSQATEHTAPELNSFSVPSCAEQFQAPIETLPLTLGRRARHVCRLVPPAAAIGAPAPARLLGSAAGEFPSWGRIDSRRLSMHLDWNERRPSLHQEMFRAEGQKLGFAQSLFYLRGLGDSDWTSNTNVGPSLCPGLARPQARLAALCSTRITGETQHIVPRVLLATHVSFWTHDPTKLRKLSEHDFLKNISKSAWILLPGISNTRIWPDYLHVVDLSLAPDAAASAARRHRSSFYI